MTETDNIAYSFADEDISDLVNLAAVSRFVARRYPNATKDKRLDIVAGLQERLLCSFWSAENV